MTTPPSSVQPWYSRTLSSVSSLVGNGLTRAGRAGEGLSHYVKAAGKYAVPRILEGGKWALTSYGKLPPVVKIPVDAGVLYLASPLTGSTQWIGLVGLEYKRFTSQETKDDHASLLQSKIAETFFDGASAINVFGRRIPLVPDKEKDPLKPLHKVADDLATFDHRQPINEEGAIPHQVPLRFADTPRVMAPAASEDHDGAPPAIDPRTTGEASNPREATDQELKTLVENMTALLPLSSMLSTGGIKNYDFGTLNEMIAEASKVGMNGKKPSLKDVFLKRYGKRLTTAQRFKIEFYNIFLSSSFFHVTVKEYGEHILKEMRERLLKKPWAKNGGIVEQLISDFNHVFDLHTSATLQYADAKKPIDEAKDYRRRAFEDMFKVNLLNLCEKFSTTLLQHLSPHIGYCQKFWFLPQRVANSIDRMLNWFVRKIIGFYLPSGLHSLIDQTNKVTQPHYLPFSNALTKTATLQLQKLQNGLNQDEPISLEPVAGTQSLPGLVQRLITVIQHVKADSPEKIKNKKKEVENKNGLDAYTDGKLQRGIQDSILMGTQFLLNHLAAEQNSEEMFKNFFALANAPFSKNAEVAVEDYNDVMETKSKALNNELYALVCDIGWKIAKDVTEGQILARRPERTQKAAAQSFAERRKNAKEVASSLIFLSEKIEKTLGQFESLDMSPESANILRDLDSMAKVIKSLSTAARIAEDLKDPRITSAAREGILRPLIPVYQKIGELTDKILALQTQQLDHKAQFQMASSLRQIDETLLLIARENPRENALPMLPTLRKTIEQMAHFLPSNATIVEDLEARVEKIRIALEKAAEQTKKLNDLAALKEHLEMFPSQKRTALQNIREDLKKIPAEDVSALKEPIRNFIDSRPATIAGSREAWKKLEEQLDQVQGRYEGLRQDALNELPQFDALGQWVRGREQIYKGYQQKRLDAMKQSHKELAQNIEQFMDLVAKVQQEKQFQLTNEQIGLIGAGVVGGLACFHPPIAALLGGLAYSGISQTGPLLQGGEDRGVAVGQVSVITAAAVTAASALPAPAPVLLAAGIGKTTGDRALEDISDGIQERIRFEIANFFKDVHTFVLSGELAVPLTKVFMKEVVVSFEGRL